MQQTAKRGMFSESCSEVSVALIRSVMTYACPAWELAADIYLLKLQSMQSKVLRTIGNFPRCSPVRDLHRAFNVPYVYNYEYVTKCAGDKQKSYKIMRMNIFGALVMVKPYTENIRGLNLVVVKLTTVQVTKLPL
jgi:hypothetical protein